MGPGSRLPREIGLQLRMGVALMLSGALFAGLAGALLYLTFFVAKGWSVAAFVALLVFIGAAHESDARERRRERPVPAGERRRLRRAVERLAVLADVPPPETVLHRDGLPLSWTSALPFREPTIHVTTGLMGRLEDRELQAVAGHELGHILHRDAVVMSLLAGPPVYVFVALREMIREEPLRATAGAVIFGLFLAVPAVLLLLLSRIVCRHRELAADRAAALLTGSPAAVAAALMQVDDGLRGRRRRDLRDAAPRDAFHFVPVRAPRRLGRLWATHPPLRRRIARMERLEAGMQR